MKKEIIQLEHITKRFPGGVLACDDVSLSLREGEVHALLGENGSGKTTLMRVLFGMYRPQAGQIRLDGAEIAPRSPRQSAGLGIGMVHQHFSLIDRFTVTQNILLGAEHARFGLLNLRRARLEIRQLCAKYGFGLDPDAPVEALSVPMRQRVELLKMLYRDFRVLIFDEPTAVLTPNEAEELMGVFRALADRGKTVVFITHRLPEVRSAADRCTVLRGGKVIGTVQMAETDDETLRAMMFGQRPETAAGFERQAPGEPVLEVAGLCVANDEESAVDSVSFTVRAGEIVCFAGADGNGENELFDAIYGLLRPRCGTIRLCGKEVFPHGEKGCRDAVSYIPEDCQRRGLAGAFSVEDNLILRDFQNPPFCRRGWLTRKTVTPFARRKIADFGIDARSPQMRADELSGGNQQKTVLARELGRPHRLLLAMRPDRGLDARAGADVLERLRSERADGKAVLVCGLELSDALAVADRIAVLHRGRLLADVPAEKADSELLRRLISGVREERP